ncbi:MAG: DUF4116 domain-containing protein, partial [Patescibacteria group bacterium]
MSICSICREEGEILVEIACPAKHTFHNACIEAWLKNNSTCPFCRGIIKCKILTVEQLFDYFSRKEKIDDNIVEALNSFSIEMQVECIEKNFKFLELLVVKTQELCRLAVEKSGYALNLVPQEMKTPELCRLAVEKDGYALKYVPQEMKTPELCRLAVEKD